MRNIFDFAFALLYTKKTFARNGASSAHLLPNGAQDKSFGVDNWADYKKYFYPDDGDYAETLRWKFVDELVNGKVGVL